MDTEDGLIRVAETKLTPRGRHPKVCQSPYGEVQVERFVYQTLCRGCVYCPLAHQDLIVHGATPRFASQLSHTYAQLNVRAVQCDLEQNHGRKVARSYMQNAAEYVGTIAMAKEGALAAAAGRSYRQHRHQPRRGHDPDGRQLWLSRGHGRHPVLLRPRRQAPAHDLSCRRARYGKQTLT